MTHEQLCERARRWLSGTRRCEPVFSNIASCSEIPDAIGWSSVYRWQGSTVIECKTSVSDFYADKRKHFDYEHPGTDKFTAYRVSGRRYTRQEAEQMGYRVIPASLMGDYRFYFCLPSVISVDQVEKNAPDHGLLHLCGRSVRVVRDAPLRVANVDKDGEIRYLRFAIINSKTPFTIAEEASEQAELNL